jgi:hemerythrin-like domain-containing protein
MQARALLMIEHRLIGRMIDVIRQTLTVAEKTQVMDPFFVDTAVDFIRMYADRTHHGKEEEILFRDLARKNLSAADRRDMDELIGEHLFGRSMTRLLVEANTRYRNGDQAALGEVVSRLHALADFYPRHILKEDKGFFPAARAYFSAAEDQAMLAEFRAFDTKMIHEKYQSVVEALGAK